MGVRAVTREDAVVEPYRKDVALNGVKCRLIFGEKAPTIMIRDRKQYMQLKGPAALNSLRLAASNYVAKAGLAVNPGDWAVIIG